MNEIKLRKLIRKTILKELSGTAGGTAAIKQRKTAAADVTSKKADKRSKKSTWDTAKKTYTTKSSAYDTKASTYLTKNTDLTAFAGNKYRKLAGRGFLYSATAQKGYSLNPDWTTKSNARTSALSDKNTASSEKDTAESDRDSAETDYDTAVSDLTASEKADLAQKKATSFAASGGGGGRASGKGGKAGTGKKGKKESIFRILGRDLINEISDIKSSLKNQKKLHKK